MGKARQRAADRMRPGEGHSGMYNRDPQGAPRPPVVEIVICTYNRAELLRAALASLEAQTAPRRRQLLERFPDASLASQLRIHLMPGTWPHGSTSIGFMHLLPKAHRGAKSGNSLF